MESRKFVEDLYTTLSEYNRKLSVYIKIVVVPVILCGSLGIIFETFLALGHVDLLTFIYAFNAVSLPAGMLLLFAWKAWRCHIRNLRPTVASLRAKLRQALEEFFSPSQSFRFPITFASYFYLAPIKLKCNSQNLWSSESRQGWARAVPLAIISLGMIRTALFFFTLTTLLKLKLVTADGYVTLDAGLVVWVGLYVGFMAMSAAGVYFHEQDVKEMFNFQNQISQSHAVKFAVKAVVATYLTCVQFHQDC